MEWRIVDEVGLSLYRRAGCVGRGDSVGSLAVAGRLDHPVGLRGLNVELEREKRTRNCRGDTANVERDLA